MKTVIRQADGWADGQIDGIKELILQKLCVAHSFKKQFSYVYAYKLHLRKVLTDAEHVRKNLKDYINPNQL